ncbi:DNA polymerase III subunit delta [Mesomycoplasma conjunctivae]|uniref:DNA polymerase III subunit delta n=1 Tax=Mesomycoplasma conjunctivae TaxID=45361 RepID=UPI003DA2486F
MFFIYGNDYYLIQEEVRKITSLNFQNNEIYHFFEGDDIDWIVDQISNKSIFDEQKVFILHNFFGFGSDAKKEKIIFEKLSNSPHKIIFSFVLLENNTKSKLLKSNLFKFFGEKINVKEVLGIDNKNKKLFIQNYAQKIDLELSDYDILQLEIKLPAQAGIIVHELKKIKNLGYNVDQNLLDNFVSDYSSHSEWGFINSFMNVEMRSIFKYYNTKILEGTPITLLIGQISNKLQQVFTVYLHRKNKLSDVVIAQKMGINVFQVKNAITFYKKIGMKKLRFMIKKLADLDVKIKKFVIDEKIGFENFILELFK